MTASLRDRITTVINLVKSGMDSPWLPVIGNIAKAALKALSLFSAISATGMAISFLHGTISKLLTPFGLLTAGATAFFYMLQQALDGPHGSQLRTTLSEIWTLTQEVGNNLKRAFSGFVEWIRQMWVQTFGGDLQDKSDSLMQSIMDGLKAVMYEVSVFTADFGLTWEYLKIASQLAWVSIQSYATQAFEQMKVYTAGFVAAAIEAFNILDEQLGITLKVNKVVEWAASAVGAIVFISEAIYNLITDFGSLLVGAYVMVKIGGMIMMAAEAMSALNLTMSVGSFTAMLNPVGLLAIGIGLLGAAFIGAKLEGMSFGDYVASMFGKLVAGCNEAVDAVNRLKKSLETEKEFAGESAKIGEAMAGEATDEKVKTLKKAEEDAAKQEEAQKKKLRDLAIAAYQDATESSDIPNAAKIDKILSGKQDGISNSYRDAITEGKTDLERTQERRKRLRERYIPEREKELKDRPNKGEPTDPLSVWSKRVKDAYKGGIDEALKGVPGEDPEITRRRQEAQNRLDKIKGEMEGKQGDNRAEDDRDRKSKERWAKARERGQPLPALAGGGMGKDGKGLGGDLTAGGRKGKGGGEIVGVVEFAKQLQASLMKTGAEEAADKTADNTTDMAKMLAEIKQQGIKIQGTIPAVTS